MNTTLFIKFRKRIGLEQINAFNERILKTKLILYEKYRGVKNDTDRNDDAQTHKGKPLQK